MTYKIKNLWPIPLYMNNIGVSEDTLDFAKKCLYERMKVKNGDMSLDTRILESMPLLKSSIEKEVKNYLNDYLKLDDKVEFYITTSWINKHIPGDHGQLHHHDNSLISGVYYIKQPENGGNFIIHKNAMTPNLFTSTINFDLNFKELTETNTRQFEVKPKDGLIIMFPSFMNHSVENNQSNEYRYSLAFNLFVRGKLGKKEGQLNV